MPHLLAADLAATQSLDLRSMACNACFYLVARGDIRAGYELASDLRQHWRQRVTTTTSHVDCRDYAASALREIEQFAEPATSTGHPEPVRRVLGDNDPHALVTADDLAATCPG